MVKPFFNTNTCFYLLLVKKHKILTRGSKVVNLICHILRVFHQQFSIPAVFDRLLDWTPDFCIVNCDLWARMLQKVYAGEYTWRSGPVLVLGVSCRFPMEFSKVLLTFLSNSRKTSFYFACTNACSPFQDGTCSEKVCME